MPNNLKPPLEVFAQGAMQRRNAHRPRRPCLSRCDQARSDAPPTAGLTSCRGFPLEGKGKPTLRSTPSSIMIEMAAGDRSEARRGRLVQT